MTKAQFFRHAHNITRHKNLAYFGGYQKAFGHVLRQLYAEGVCYGFQMDPAGKAKTWYGA